jgi:N-acetyl-gamma-glutamyl-phosphate reductase
MKKIRVGIIGATGYTGSELLRLLLRHPYVDLKAVGSRKEAGTPVADLFPHLRKHTTLKFIDSTDLQAFYECDVVFFATPHGAAMKAAPELRQAGCKIIDLAADFRIRDTEVFKKWYGMDHTCPDILAEAVYGLAEINREKIKHADVIGLAGCYPTAVQLGLAPVLQAELIDAKSIIADCKSGISGAGRKAEIELLSAENQTNFRAYALKGHRHQPEILQGLCDIVRHDEVHLHFVPHLVPNIRGIHATIYARIAPEAKAADFQQLYEHFYANEPFVDVLPAGSHPETRSVAGTNQVCIAVHQQGDLLIILVVEDNLVKGAAGQGVQCMNLMFNCPETAGLELIALVP